MDNNSSFKDRIVKALRRPQVWGFFLSMAVMAFVSLAFFAPDNFEGNSLSQHDMQQGAANGEEARAFLEQTGEKTLWTNSLFSGMPTFQISPDYPSNSLFTWLNSVYGLGLPSPSNLLFMMMFGMLIMCYCMRMRWWYALIAAVAWGLSSYFVIIIGAGHIWKFLALTYVPPTIGALCMAYRGRYLSGGALMALFAMLQLNANHPQISYYSGFIMLALAIAFLVADVRQRRLPQWLKATAACLVAGILALGANLPSLYNTYEYSKETKRAQSELTPLAKADTADADERPTGGLPKSEIGGWSNTPSESFSLLIPNIKGGATILPQKGQNTFLSLAQLPGYADDLSIQSNDAFNIIPQLGQYFGGKGLTNGPFYMGALICALFLLGCLIVRGPVKWALVVVTLFSILLAMGNHFEALTDFMIYNVPLYNKFRAAETALVIAALCMPLLGAMGLQKLLGEDGGLKRYRWQVVTALAVPAAVCLLAWMAPAVFGQPFGEDELKAFAEMRAQIEAYMAHGSYPPTAMEMFESSLDSIASLRYHLVSSDAARSLVVLVIGGGILLLAAARCIQAWLGALGVGLVVLFDLYGVDKRYVNTESFAEEQLLADNSPLAADEIDRQILQDTGYYRVADLSAFGDARRSMFHHMVGGYHAAKLNRYNDLIERRMSTAQGYGTYIPEVRDDSLINAEPADRQKVLRALAADYRVLDMLNARYIIGRDGLKTNPYAMGPAWLVPEIRYVDNADAEMQALATIDPAAVAVADKRFADALGAEAPSLAPGDTVVMDSYKPNRLDYTVSTRNGGIVVFSEVWFPWGWHATIDGNPADLGRVNYVLRALRVPAGKHQVAMWFDPESVHTTSAIAYGSVTVIYLALALALFFAYLRSQSPDGRIRRRKDRKQA